MPHLLVLLPPDPVCDALRSLGIDDELGPHITVKAQPGLDDDRRPVWLPRVRRALTGVDPFAVQLGPVGAFGDDVAYLEVLSDPVRHLHRLLVAVVDPPPEEADRAFELDGWHPHLTLRRGPGAGSDDLRAAVAGLGPLPAFAASEVWLVRQDASGACVLDEPLPLGALETA